MKEDKLGSVTCEVHVSTKELCKALDSINKSYSKEDLNNLFRKNMKLIRKKEKSND